MSLRNLFTNKKLQKHGKEIFNKLVKCMQSSSALLKELANFWADGNKELCEKTIQEIIQTERQADDLKEELVESVLLKGAFLPYTTEERYMLVEMIDEIIDSAEDAARLIGVYDVAASSIPNLIKSLAEKVWICTDRLQDSIKFLYEDFAAAIKFGEEVEEVREDARDIYYEILGKVLSKKDRDPLQAIYLKDVAASVLEVAIRAETTADFVQKLAVMHR